ncbi:MAG: aminoacyl-tRNA hydrolase [Planctomycetota bacterium]|jgi:PTH1 family peptidyl-tRNA hydrolase|nr:aminoacyl-tRNA hydrolase [Planctomycetota bacterium]
MRLVVGLGNPGREYALTRHNLGWQALDALASRLAASRFHREGAVEVGEIFTGGEKIFLLKPLIFMNCSGEALASWLGRFREVAEAIKEELPGENAAVTGEAVTGWPRLLVLADDVNLPLGKMRFRPEGSAGGHNGLKNLEKVLGSQAYPRLRLGVGAPPDRVDRVDYVLGRFSPADCIVAEQVARLAAEAVECWLREGMARARDLYNGREVAGAEAPD